MTAVDPSHTDSPALQFGHSLPPCRPELSSATPHPAHVDIAARVSPPRPASPGICFQSGAGSVPQKFFRPFFGDRVRYMRFYSQANQ